MDSANPIRSGASPASHLSSRSQHLLSSSTSASPSINRIAPSLSASSSGSPHTHGHSTSSSSILTMEILLAQHANAVNPTETALEALLVDRNNLSQQNAQLWKFAEKQKAMYANLLRENDRLRGERDQYKMKWQKLKNSSLATASTIETLTVIPSEKESNVDEASSVLSSSSSNIPVAPDPVVEKPRHSLEDPTTPRNTSGFGSESNAPSEYYTPFQTPVRDQDGQASNGTHSMDSSMNAVNASQSPPTITTTQNHSDILPPSLTKPSEPDANSSARAAQSLRPVSPIPLVVPPRTDSVNALASSSRSQTNNTSSSVHSHSAAQNHDSTACTTTSNGGKSNIPQSINNHLAPYPHIHHNRPNISMELSRESRITLPEEARQYIANMMESPQLSSTANSSPHLEQNSRPSVHRSNSAPDKAAVDNNKQSMQSQKEETDPELEESQPRPSISTITSIGTTATDYSYPYGGQDVPGGSESELEDLSTEDSAFIEISHNHNDQISSKSNISSKARGRTRSGTTADQFPLPPSSLGLGVNTNNSSSGHMPPSPRSTAFLRSLNTSVSAPVAGNTTSPSSYSPNTATVSGLHGGIGTATSLPAAGGSSSNADSSTSSNSIIDKEGDLMRQNEREKESESATDRSSWLPFREGSKLFRQMPLLDNDLKNTSTRVIGSHIKANEKGKEVLTFVIGVDVRGKPGWVIEKFYSDVLALDSRLKQLCNRSTIKKIAPLPDNKLFKDHAPSKVDQRKQMLQAYLQSLLQLPLKDKNEIIVFFSSDMMRDYGPVTQTGYKEGYLTKRGKNFGGWKTRYFVLQGPVLEYYESRGGNHLGSIQVTGAQIGRQQKYGNDKRELEDDNEYRHAFLIIETKKNSTGQHPRHVLCAESDEERDAWVDVLVRYVMGTYNEELTTPVMHTINPPPGTGGALAPGLTTNTSNSSHRVQPPIEGSQKHTSQSASNSSLDPINTNSAPNGADLKKSSPLRGMDSSPIDRFPPTTVLGSSDAPKSKKDPYNSNALEDGLSTSLPTSSPLDAANTSVNIGLRANSELGHYPDLVDQRSHSRSPENQRRGAARISYHPTLQPIMASSFERPITPEHHSPINQHPSSSYLDANANKSKISGPMNGVPIPTGYQFGSRDPPAEVPSHSNDRERKAKSRIFWGFGRPNNEKVQSRPVFGLTLEDSLAVSQIASLPSIVFRCIQYLEAKHAELEEGLYRLSGSSNVIKGLKDRFDTEGDVDLLGSDDYWDIHAIAGLLKQYLRELAAPILTHELNMKFHTVIDLYDADERVREVQELISLLPIANYSLLRTMMSHLIHVIANSNTNKMTVRNVGIVFCPTLGISPPVLNLMLGDFRKVFNVVDEDNDSPNDTTTSSMIPNISRRNSKHYSTAAADQLLGLANNGLPNKLTDEGQSDDAADELSTNDESGTENATTEADVEDLANSIHLDAPTLINRAPSPVGIRVDSVSASVSENGERTPQRSRVANVAASRGLNLTVDGNSKADRRNSRMIGLPASPRATRPPQSPSFPPILAYTEDSSNTITR